MESEDVQLPESHRVEADVGQHCWSETVGLHTESPGDRPENEEPGQLKYLEMHGRKHERDPEYR